MLYYHPLTRINLLSHLNVGLPFNENLPPTLPDIDIISKCF